MEPQPRLAQVTQIPHQRHPPGIEAEDLHGSGGEEDDQQRGREFRPQALQPEEGQDGGESDGKDSAIDLVQVLEEMRQQRVGFMALDGRHPQQGHGLVEDDQQGRAAQKAGETRSG